MRRTENDWMQGISKYVPLKLKYSHPSPFGYSGQPHFFRKTAAEKQSWTGETFPHFESNLKFVHLPQSAFKYNFRVIFNLEHFTEAPSTTSQVPCTAQTSCSCFQA